MPIKKFLPLVAFLLLSALSSAQKYDYNWIIGGNVTNRYHRSMRIDFNDSTPKVSLLPDRFRHSFANTCSMSDSSGQLIFYTNGLHIFNIEDTIMQYGDTLNPGKFRDDYDRKFGSQGLWQPPIAIHFPGHPDEYLLFHISVPIENLTTNLYRHAPFYFSRIDMRQNGGLGAVIEKNVVIGPVQESFSHYALIRHANGRDWWCIILKDKGRSYFRYLINPEGITREDIPLAPSIQVPFGGYNMLRAAPDGTMISSSDINEVERVHLLEFDRCVGMITNRRTIVMPITRSQTIQRMHEFSPDSRYLYFIHPNEIMQIDVKDPNPAETIYPVAESDHLIETFITSFIFSQLGPDGKLYVSTGNDNRLLHVINRPNLPGIACDVRQHGLDLPSYNFLGLPNFPNYRLHALEGSPCDTIRGPTLPVPIDSTNGEFEVNGVWYRHAFKP